MTIHEFSLTTSISWTYLAQLVMTANERDQFNTATECSLTEYVHTEYVLSTCEGKDLDWQTADELGGEVEEPDGRSRGHP